MSDIARGRGIVDAIAPRVPFCEWAVTQDGSSWRAATLAELEGLHAAGETCTVSVPAGEFQPATLVELGEFLRLRDAGPGSHRPWVAGG